jgi:hypothetical protein
MSAMVGVPFGGPRSGRGGSGHWQVMVESRPRCRGDEIGKHSGLKIRRLTAYGFKSRPRHHRHFPKSLYRPSAARAIHDCPSGGEKSRSRFCTCPLPPVPFGLAVKSRSVRPFAFLHSLIPARLHDRLTRGVFHFKPQNIRRQSFDGDKQATNDRFDVRKPLHILTSRLPLS